MYCTAIEAEIGVESKDKLEADITTNTGTDTKDIVNSNDSRDFNPIKAEDDQINININDN